MISSTGSNSGLTQSLLQNPQMIQSLIPNVNLSSLAEALQASLQTEEAPLSNLSSELSTLSSQSQAWSQVSSALQTVQTDVQNLSTTQDLNPSGDPVSSSPDVATATGTAAPVGDYAVSVTQLAQNQVTNSDVVTETPSSALGYSGTLTLTDGTQTATVTVASTDSMDNIAQSIQAAAATIPGFNLTASVLPSGKGTALSLSADTGSGSFSIAASGSNLPLTFTQSQASQNAIYSVNGVDNTSAVNNIQDALAPGVTLNLLEAGSTTLTVSPNYSQVTTNTGNLVKDVMSAINTINSVAGQGGVLEGNAALLNVGQSLVSDLSQTNTQLPVGYQSLADIGLTVAYTQSGGEQVSLNSGKFEQALNTDPGAVTQLFVGNSGSGSSGTTGGIASSMNQYLNGFLAPSTGMIASGQSGISQQEKMIASEQTSMQQLVQQEQTTADNSFIADLQNMLSESTTSTELTAQFNQASGSGSSGSSGS